MNEASEKVKVSESAEFDIAIVGAGLVGLPLAAVLAKQGWQVGLLDAEKTPLGNVAPSLNVASAVPEAISHHTQEHSDANLFQRCTALSLGTQQWYAENGLWEIVASDASPIDSVNVSHKGYFGATRLKASELGVPAVGYVVNNAEFIHQQRQHLPGTAVHHVNDARVSSIHSQDELITLQTHTGRSYRTRLLVAADGVGSVVRETAGIGVTHVDYQQAAVLGMVKLDQPHEGVAHERFTPSGPLAMLPRTGRYMSFVDCIEPDSQDAIDRMSTAHYLDRLQRRFGYRLGRMSAVGPRFVTPLVRIEAQTQIAARTVLLGNAMRLLHPVGGQGYNLAMRDVAQLVSLLGAALHTDPGNEALLAKFVELRQADQQRVVQFTDLLARGFRGKAGLPGHVRSAALLGLDTLTPLRHKFASQTMGYAPCR